MLSYSQLPCGGKSLKWLKEAMLDNNFFRQHMAQQLRKDGKIYDFSRSQVFNGVAEKRFKNK